ncbi:serine/threonine protein kinase [Candidatus Uabimicrobium sp. HlEnr_7]|uniref:serine/threonine protein kinase n=1 Tax=Candidatus Uabimicrobium helgolandensis TaxID=3095367 RepID=UPI003556D94E
MKVIPNYFGEIVVSEGYVSQKVVVECLNTQKLYREPKLIGEVMKEKGLLSDEQIQRVLKMQTIYRTKLDNEYFAHIAFKSRVLNSNQVKQLRKRHENESLQGKLLNFASIAMMDNYIVREKVEEIIKDSEFQHFRKLKSTGKSTVRGYELVGILNKVKKASIYKAIQVELDRLVVVKVLSPEFENYDNIRKFFHEAKITARFNHPNLVRIYDKGVDNNMYYYAMELVDGQNLSGKLDREKRLQVGESLRIIKQIARALQHMHSLGRVHTEVHPRNIMIRDDGVSKLLDLSASRSTKSGPAKSIGKITKMPQYMAPEQFSTSSQLDASTDIYCLGACFYRMLTGNPPASGKSIEDIKTSIINNDPTPITSIDFTIPEKLAKIVHRMIRKDPKKRYREIKNLMFALKRILI